MSRVWTGAVQVRDRLRRAAVARIAELDDGDYAAFGFDHRPLKEATGYVGWPACARWLPVLNTGPDLAVLDDKEEFRAVLAARGLPVPETVAVFDPRTDDPHEVRAALTAYRDGLVVKPARGGRGRGVVIFTDLDEDARTGTTVRGKKVRLVKALERSAAAVQGPVVVQRRLRQHHAMDPYAPQGHSTVRVYTLRRVDGTLRHVGAHLRLGRRHSMTDHVWGGSVGADIDVDTGLVGQGVQVSKAGYEPTDRHPETGVVFRGTTVPWWGEVRALCETVAQLFPEVRFVGWDVMVTDDGPRMLEGNRDIRLRTLQVLRGGVLDDGLRADLEELGVTVPRGWLQRAVGN